ncbi:MAG: phage minor head protein [Methanotrichaceae archaeon]
MSEERAVKGLLEVVIPVIKELRAVDYFDAAEAALKDDQHLSIAFWKPMRRTLLRKNAKFWPLIIEDMRHDRAKKYFINHGANKLVGNMTNSDIKFLKRFVRDNWGTPPRECVKKLQESYLCSPARAKRIIRTERHTAQGGSDLERELERGVTEFKTWSCVSDGASRDEHVLRHGETVRLNEPFSGGVMFPGDGPAYECINCRCRLVFTMKRPDPVKVPGAKITWQKPKPKA